MVARFNPPTRNQLARIARDENGRVDDRLVRAFEQLWKTGGQEVPDIDEQIKENTAAIFILDGRVTVNEGNIDALEIRMTVAEVAIAANAARIKTNEVLLWLSM